MGRRPFFEAAYKFKRFKVIFFREEAMKVKDQFQFLTRLKLFDTRLVLLKVAH